MQELIIFKKSYDFSKWLFNHTNKFPKSHRFSVAVKLENGILELLRQITIANHRQKKLPLLHNADEELIDQEHPRFARAVSFEVGEERRAFLEYASIVCFFEQELHEVRTCVDVVRIVRHVLPHSGTCVAGPLESGKHIHQKPPVVPSVGTLGKLR